MTKKSDKNEVVQEDHTSSTFIVYKTIDPITFLTIETSNNMEPILHFTKENRWLSNFWPCVVEYKGKKYPSSEHAYMAQKTTDPVLAEQIRLAQTSREAKALGRKVVLREGWEEMKYQVMLDVVRCKFQQNADIREKLIATGDAHLEEGNWWNDTYWGVCRGKGENNLGKILMLVRQELRVWKECNE